MQRKRCPVRTMLAALAAWWTVSSVQVLPAVAATGDFDENGYVDQRDYVFLEICFSFSGPGVTPPFQECTDAFDADGDGDVDLADYGVFASAMGHLPIPLRDTLGNVLTVDSSAPYSGRQTCAGSCHVHDLDDPAGITNGLKFQQGRTDVDGNIILQDDYLGDGRWWIRGGARYGMALPVGSASILAGKDNANESAIDLTTFAWVAQCGGCHTGGGPGEFDRDGVRLYDPSTGQFGYEVLGKTPEQVSLDGDYTYMDGAGDLHAAPWDATGLSETDCLYCHTPDPKWGPGADTERNARRSAVLKATDQLVDSEGASVPAFLAAGAAGQGWFSALELGPSGTASVLQLDYSVGVNAGTLLADGDGAVALARSSVDFPPRDKACWSCHTAAGVIRGQVWFDDRDIHYGKLNNLRDEDPSNDIPPEKSTSCNYCHPGGLDHNFAKGNSPIRSWREELNWVGLRSCRSCHLPFFPDGTPNPDKHPDAPDVPGDGSVEAHMIGFSEGENGPMAVLSCQACHIPYALLSPALAVHDLSVTGSSMILFTSQFYSVDPLDPSNPDKSRWYPNLKPKVDSDGVVRYFPEALFHYVYWADWDRNGTPDDFSDDAIAPIPLWRVRDLTGGAALPAATDDSGDGKIEINRPEEILAYIQALKGNDHYGRQVAANPVLVKGVHVWHEDPDAPGEILAFDPNAAGIPVDLGGRLGISHNVLAAADAWGAGSPPASCDACHRHDGQSPVMDRLIVVDPYGVDGQPVYETVRDLTGLNPP